jgi:maltoporin
MHHKRMHMAPMAVAALIALLGAPSANALDLHGYLRSGTGSSDKGGKQTCFSLPGAYTKYRLGNECETYGELQFDQNVYDGKDGVKFDFTAMFAYKSDYNGQQDYEALTGGNDEWAFRQAYVNVRNLPMLNGANVWAGKRYYKRQDIHITDFYYWDTSGYGGGIEDIRIGPGKFSYALFGNNDSGSDRSMWRNDFRYEGLGIGFGSLDFGLNWNIGHEGGTAPSEDGWAINVQHVLGGFLGGYNKLAFQWGEGSASNLVYPYPDYGANSDKESWRIVESLQFQQGPLGGMATFVYQDQKNNYTWWSLGGRVVYAFNNYFKLAGEIGYDQVEPDGQKARKLTKFTIAPILATGQGFWNRPELRLYYTYATWNDAARDGWGGVAGGVGGKYGNGTSGSQIGVQVEGWW